MEDLDIISRSRTFKYGISKSSAISEGLVLLEDILKNDKRSVRRVGVRLTDLLPALKCEGSSSADHRSGGTSLSIHHRAGSPAHYPYPLRDSGVWDCLVIGIKPQVWEA